MRVCIIFALQYTSLCSKIGQGYYEKKNVNHIKIVDVVNCEQ